uniref:Peptidase S1 domain-containing protein n=1 Tax=Rhodnius prolixus TaxID=13249 RepID=T1I8B9_RHOPR
MNSSQKLKKHDEDPNIPSIVGIRNGNMFCTGFILDSDWVLTAARCVAASGITMVFAGTPDIYGPGAIEAQSSLIVKHPKYDYSIEELGGHDIALIKVDLSFQLDKVKILPLSDENWPLNDHTYKRFCKIIGFGSVEGDRDKPSLHVNEVFAEHGYKACSGCTEGDQQYQLVCLKRGDDIGICGSDIGGPLICDGKAVAVAHKILVGQCTTVDVILKRSATERRLLARLCTYAHI